MQQPPKPPYRDTFDKARTPYDARVALGIPALLSGFLTTTAAAATYVPFIGGTMTGILHLLGVTDGSSEASGKVGEEQSASQAVAQALTSITAKTLCSVTLPAGEWEIEARAGFIGDATTTVNVLSVCAGNANNTFLDQIDRTNSNMFNSITVFNQVTTLWKHTPRFTVHINANTTYYCTVFAKFATATCSATGQIFARRIR